MLHTSINPESKASCGHGIPKNLTTTTTLDQGGGSIGLAKLKTAYCCSTYVVTRTGAAAATGKVRKAAKSGRAFSVISSVARPKDRMTI